MTPTSPRDTLGRALQDLRVSVTDRCNFRCGYCMPQSVFGPGYRFMRRDELLDPSELMRLLEAFAALGVRKLRLTGGEPLLRPDLTELVERAAGIDEIEDIALTTNAALLTAERARDLREAGVRRVNISLDALDETVYRRINPIPTPLQQVLDGIEHALSAGFHSVKINMVVQKGLNDGEILPLARYFRGRGAVLRFIEFMDVGNHNRWDLSAVVTAREILDRIAAEYPIEPLDPNYSGEVARRWRYVDGGGEIGVISSVSQPFCRNCSRARLSANGQLFTCLFAERGRDLRPLLAEHPEPGALSGALADLWRARDDRYSELRATGGGKRSRQKVEMSYIGG